LGRENYRRFYGMASGNSVTLALAGGMNLTHATLPFFRRAEHHMAMPAIERRRWTAVEVRALIDANPLQTPRYELVDGELLVTPSPGAPHVSVSALLMVALHAYLARERLGVAWFSPADVELEPEVITQPDIFVVPVREKRRVLAEGNPMRELLLAVEILSPSSARHDRIRKRPYYQRTVPEYWIVDINARLVERWRPGDDRPEIIEDVLEWHPEGAIEAFRLLLQAMFAGALDE
jgi:Uma2 family endonuclease